MHRLPGNNQKDVDSKISKVDAALVYKLGRYRSVVVGELLKLPSGVEIVITKDPAINEFSLRRLNACAIQAMSTADTFINPLASALGLSTDPVCNRYCLPGFDLLRNVDAHKTGVCLAYASMLRIAIKNGDAEPLEIMRKIGNKQMGGSTIANSCTEYREAVEIQMSTSSLKSKAQIINNFQMICNKVTLCPSLKIFELWLSLRKSFYAFAFVVSLHTLNIEAFYLNLSVFPMTRI